LRAPATDRVAAVAETGPAGSRVATQFAGVRMPRVAVVIGCHDQAAYVEAAIRSVAVQSYQDFECVVVDDSSGDGSAGRIEEVLKSLGDPRFRAILRRENGGQMVTMLAGLDATSGPFVAFLDGDDLWHPEFLERHVLAHMSPRGVAAVSCSNLAVIDAAGVQLSGAKPNFTRVDPRQAHRQFKVTEEVLEAETRLFVARGIPRAWIWSATSAMMFRRAVLEVLRPARPERLRICADNYLVKGAHMLGGTVRIERSLGCYRLHGGNGFSSNKMLGDRTALGRLPQDIAAAVDEEFVRCLCDMAVQLRSTLTRGYVARLLVELVGAEGATALAATNDGARIILSDVNLADVVPPPVPPQRPGKRPKLGKRLKKIKRRLTGWLQAKRDRTADPD